jgi:hypothetical protein
VAELVVLNGARAGAVFDLPEIPTVLGRSPEAHFQVDDPWISSMHAMFERRGAELWIVDLESRNGTFLGDERVQEARLDPGALLRFGRTEARLERQKERPDRTVHPTPPATRAVAERDVASRPTGKIDPAIIEAVRQEAARPGASIPLALTPLPGPRLPLAERPIALLRLALQLSAGAPAPTAEGVRAAIEALVRATLHEGGLSVRVGGAGTLAAFGLSGPSPDDVDFALRAARGARASVRSLKLGLDVRAAVDAGPILVGNVSGPEGFELAALGEATERIERVLALAGPGEILAGPGATEGSGLGAPALIRLGADELAVARLIR